jgi:tetratricopeptide (TPR) repeat protein
VADRFPDGQLYVDLRGYDPDQPIDASDALAGFLRALGVAGQDIPHAPAERAARYRSLLAGRRVLVVLDNAGRAEQVRPLLPGGPSCFAVVTSRDGLAGLVARDGARHVDLDLLSPTESLDLLRALIGDRVDADPGAARALARRCAHLPLALRVAAQIVAGRPARRLADLVDELAGEHGALDAFRAGDDDRSAVRSVFWWSYRRLPAATARMFRLLGLHPGTDLDGYAAAALAGAHLVDARRILGGLTEAHLVQEKVAGRYRMHDLLRAYAAERARDDDDGERRAAQSRLVDHYLSTAGAAMDLLYPGERYLRPCVAAVAEPATPMCHAEHARAWLDSERANLAATIGYAVDHGWPAQAADLAATISRYLALGAHFDEALVVHGHALRAAVDLGDGHRQAAALTNLGGIHYDLGHYDEAVEHYRRARPRFRAAGDRVGEARVLSNLGIMHAMRGRYAAALHHYRQALDIYRETGNEHGHALTLGWVGLELGRRGDHAEALEHLTHALATLRRIGPRYRELEVVIDLGRVHHWAGHHDEALAFAQQVLALKDEAVDHYYEVQALNLLAEIYRATGRTQEALTCYRSTLALAPDIGYPEAHARALAGIAELENAAGRPDSARRHWQEALAIYTELHMPEADEIRARLDAG